MTVYVIAQLTFTDESKYRRYQSRFAEVFNRSPGRLLCADENPVSLEGHWDRDKIVVMSFENDTEARTFLTSPEYIDISADRKAGSDALAILVQGVTF